MAYTNARVISSCKHLYIKGQSYTGVTSASVTVTHVESGSAAGTPYTLNYTGPGDTGQVLIAVEDLPTSGGVYQIDVLENGSNVASRLVLIKCDIDCCLVKLTDELIDCHCDCAKCASSLAKAQKIYLLIHSAETAIEIYNITALTNPGYAQDASSKYTKAKELCDASCGCDC